MNINLTIPKKWNDLSVVQLENIVYQIYCFHTIIKDNAKEAALVTAKLYLQLAKELLRGNKWFAVSRALKEIHPKEFLPWTNFLYEHCDRTKFLPAFKVKGHWYHPPAQRLRNVTIGEFAFTDAAWYQWHTTQKVIWLNVMCAAVYREESGNPTQIDNRIPFVKQAVDARADKFSKVPLKKKLAIASCFEGCRNHIAKTYPAIFPKPHKEEDATAPVKRKYVSFGKVVIEKLDGDPSRFEAVNNLLAYDFLNIMTSDIDRARKQKR